jgi:hypothetical protein
MGLLFGRRKQAHQFAREAYSEANGDVAKAEELFKAKCGAAGMDPATILQLILLAIKLWQMWNDMKGKGQDLTDTGESFFLHAKVDDVD